jgi:hypothetical protein
MLVAGRVVWVGNRVPNNTGSLLNRLLLLISSIRYSGWKCVNVPQFRDRFSSCHAYMWKKTEVPVVVWHRRPIKMQLNKWRARLREQSDNTPRVDSTRGCNELPYTLLVRTCTNTPWTETATARLCPTRSSATLWAQSIVSARLQISTVFIHVVQPMLQASGCI